MEGVNALNSKIRVMRATIFVHVTRVRKFWRDTNVLDVDMTLSVLTKSDTEVSFPVERMRCFDSNLDSMVSSIKDIAKNSSVAKRYMQSGNEGVSRIAMYRAMDLEATPCGIVVRWFDHKGNLLGNSETDADDDGMRFTIESALSTDVGKRSPRVIEDPDTEN